MTRRNQLTSIRPQSERTKETHAGLWLDRYLSSNPDMTKIRHTLTQEVASLPMPVAYQAFFNRWEKMLGEYKAITRKATAKGRMIVGLGDESVLETSIALHHTYGVPYIPGSALKGLASSYAHQKLGENWQKGSAAHNIVFGNTDEAGYITFFDALYVPDSGHHGQALYPDIITVHHQDYYNTGKDNAPADWDSPNPVPFLSATGSYLIALAAPDLPANNEWVLRAFDILEHALKEIGIGAKTSSGYGRMVLEVDQNGPGMEEARNFQQQLDTIPPNLLAGQFNSLFSKWRDLPLDAARILAAKAIIKKIQDAGIEHTMAARPQYKVLREFASK